MNTRFDSVKSDARVTVLTEMPGRLLIRVNFTEMTTDPRLKGIRHKDPSDISLLQASTKRTDGALYPMLLFVRMDGDLPEYVVADGHQRKRADEANGKKDAVCIIPTTWQTIDDALRDCASANWARYEVTEADTLALLGNGVSKPMLIEITGFSQSKADRMEKIARYPDLIKLVQKKVATIGLLYSLLKECDNDLDRETALVNTILDRFEKASTISGDATVVLRELQSKNKQADKGLKAQADLKKVFKSLVDTDALKVAVHDPEAIEVVDGRPIVKLSDDSVVSHQYKQIRIGSDQEWKEQIAIFGLDGTKIDDADPDDLFDLLNNWEQTGEKLRAIYNLKVEQETRKLHEIPSSNPKASRTKVPKPEQQQAVAEVITDDDEPD